MASEQGVVVRSDASGTWVNTIRTETCESCASRGACHTLGGGKEMEVAAVNSVGARVGERVVLRMDTASFLKATFLVYLFPILLLIVGAAAGEMIARSTGLDSSLPAALMGFGSLGVGLLVMRTVANRLARKDAYRPRIVRILGRAVDSPNRQ